MQLYVNLDCYVCGSCGVAVRRTCLTRANVGMEKARAISAQRKSMMIGRFRSKEPRDGDARDGAKEEVVNCMHYTM